MISQYLYYDSAVGYLSSKDISIRDSVISVKKRRMLNVLQTQKYHLKDGNMFNDLSCPYYDPIDGDPFQLIWDNSSYGRAVQVLSHVCLNGSFSHLNISEWNRYCFPYFDENVGLRRVTGVWAVFIFLFGAIGNILTLVAIPYAKWKQKHGFHKTFWTTDIWVLHLCLCDLIFCLFCSWHYIIPYLGLRYPQGNGWDYVCAGAYVLSLLTHTNDWLLVSVIAATRAIHVIEPDKWRTFCKRRICVIFCQVLTWIVQLMILLPVFLQPSMSVGYNCLMGKCNYIPTGKDSLPVFDIESGQPWIVTYFPYLAPFIIPCLIIIISYVVIWMHIRTISKSTSTHLETRVPNLKKKQLNKNELKFIWTIFMVCTCFLLCAAPVTIVVNILNLKSDMPFLIVVSLMWCQFSINVLIYAYRSEQYRASYWDVLILIFPFLLNFRKKIKKRMSNMSKSTRQQNT